MTTAQACCTPLCQPADAVCDLSDTFFVGAARILTTMATVTLYVLAASWRFAQAAWADAVRCRHTRTVMVEGKTYCPDCGEGVVFAWVILRCSHCRRIRPARYSHESVATEDRCCRHCGTHHVEKVRLEAPDYFQAQFALLEKQPDRPQQTVPRVVGAWVEPCPPAVAMLTG